MLASGFLALQSGYDVALHIALRFKLAALSVMLATVAATVLLFVVISKGFFLQQDTGMITGMIEVASNVSLSQMKSVRFNSDSARINRRSSKFDDDFFLAQCRDYPAFRRTSHDVE